MSKKPHPLDRAWAAGVFDARGTVPKSGYVLRFESTNEAIMQKFFETVEVGSLNELDKKQCVHPVFAYKTLNMDDTRELLLLLSPFLTAVRLTQAAEMIARIERNPTWQKKHPKKATSSVTSPVVPAEAETTEQNTQTAG